MVNYYIFHFSEQAKVLKQCSIKRFNNGFLQSFLVFFVTHSHWEVSLLVLLKNEVPTIKTGLVFIFHHLGNRFFFFF